MNLSEVEEKIEEIFCKKISEQLEQYGLVRLTEMATKLVDDLEKQTNSKEVYLCKKIIEFLIGLIRNCSSTSSPKFINQLQQSSSNDDHLSSSLKSGSAADDKGSRKRPPTPPKKPKINRNFHSFQYVSSINSSKDSGTEMGASNSSLSTVTSGANNQKQPQQQQQNKTSPAQQSITATRTSSTFASISKNGSKHQSINSQFLQNQQKALQNPKYTETCLDKDTAQFEENAYEIKDLGFGSKPKLNSFGVNSKLLNKNAASSANNQSSQPHGNNSYPRHPASQQTAGQQLRSKFGDKKTSNFFQFNQQNHPNSLKDSLNYGSTDALCKNSSNAAASSIKSSFFSRKGSLDKHSGTSNQQHHAYLPDFGRRNLRLSEDFGSSTTTDPMANDEEESVMQKSLEDNGEITFENYETEEELDRKEVETEDEAIYDTVAPDEVNVGSQSSSLATNSKLNNANLKASLVKSLKNSFENRLLNQSMENLEANNDGCYSQSADNRIYSNYVNIDYFLRSKNDSDDCVSQSLSSDHDIDESIAPLGKLNSSSNDLLDTLASNGTPPIQTDMNAAYDEVFECKKELKNSKSSVLSTQYSIDSSNNELDDDDIIRTEAELLSMYRSIIQNIIESENVYLDCLDTLIQYKKALKSSTESTQPLLKTEQLECIFYQIPELFKIHSEFIVGVQELSQSSGDNSTSIKIRTNTPTLGDLFKNLAAQLDVYSSYLRNYSAALETLRVCCQANEQFNGIAMSIKLKSQKITTSLQELLHKPVARVQKNALVLHDLLKYTGQNSEEHKSLQTALQMTQRFLNDLNIAATENLFSVIFLLF